VTRFLALDAVAPGDYDVIVDGLTQYVNPDSLRVTGVGHVTLLQVSYDEVWVDSVAPSPPAPGPTTEAQLASERLPGISARIDAISAELEQITKQASMFTQFAKRIVAPEGGTAPPRDLAYISDLITKQEQTLRALSARKLALQSEREELAAEAAVLRKAGAAAAVTSTSKPAKTKTRRVIVSVRVDALSPVELRVYYLTSNASWKSSYGNLLPLWRPIVPTDANGCVFYVQICAC
jgi:hypothetical protein